METLTQTTERAAILDALGSWINQRPGLEFGCYGDVAAYRAEQRAILTDKKHALILLSAVRWRDSITADDLKAAFRAYSGRLSWDGEKLDYCTGQYWPTEYRAAACAVLASILWAYWRDCADPATEGEPTQQPGIVDIGGYIRKQARREFGRTIASRWFN